MFLLQTFDVGGRLGNKAVERPDHLNFKRIVASHGVARKEDSHQHASYTSILTPFFNVYLQ